MNKHLSSLRSKAEGMIDQTTMDGREAEQQDIKALVMELQIHQLELEMQNDELTKANETLELQQLKFESIYNLAPIGYFILNSFGEITQSNETGKMMLGSEGFLTSYRFHQYVDNGYKDSFLQFFHNVVKHGKKQTVKLKLNSLSGRVFYVQAEGTAVRVADTSSVQCYVAIMDIDDLANARHNLLKVKSRLELALDAASAGVWELDVATMTFNFDDMCCSYLRLNTKSSTLSFYSFLKLVHPDDRLSAEEQFRIAISSDSAVAVAFRCVVNNEEVLHLSMKGSGNFTEFKNFSFTGILLDVTRNTLLEQEEQVRKNNIQRRITVAMFNAEERERQRISSVLHDSIGQLLYGIKLQLPALSGNVHSQASKHINKLLDQAIRETRNISFELAPAILSDFGLNATIEDLCQRLSTSNFRINFIAKGDIGRLDLKLETGLYRIIQELINNSMRHGEATRIDVTLIKTGMLLLSVEDNGKGFDFIAEDKLPTGSGLSGIKNRLSLYNGTIEILSEHQKGTKVIITLDI